MEPSKAGHVPSGRKEYKDEQLFARLIGAAVLLALAVIILPFVLDGSGSQKEYEYAETLPVEPAKPAVEKSFSSRQTLTPPPSADSFEIRTPEATSLAGLTPTSPVVASGELQNVSSGADQNGVSASAIQFETLGNNTVGNNSLGNGGANSADGIDFLPLQTGWNIQVASFVREENAIKLVKRLRGQNHGAYSNRVKGKTRTLIRVLVGPYTNQIDALAQQNQIDRDYRVESIVVRRK